VINIGGLGSPVQSVSVQLIDLNHTFPDDIDVLLVGPTGANLILMSDVGGSTDAVNVSLTLQDGSPALPDAGPLVSGTFAPTNVGAGDTFGPPAPAAAPNSPAPAGTSTLATVFDGTNGNGVWRLFIVDDAGGDTGTLAGGWCLTVADQNVGTLSGNVSQQSGGGGFFASLFGGGGSGTPTPVEGATVTAGGETTTTDANGNYSMTVPAGATTANATTTQTTSSIFGGGGTQTVNCPPANASVNIPNGGTTNQNFTCPAPGGGLFGGLFGGGGFSFGSLFGGFGGLFG
jgi:hypothetical protein